MFNEAQKYRNNGEIEKAIELYKQVREEALKKEDRKMASECLHMIGVACYQDRRFDEAKNYLNKSLEEFKEENNLEFAGFVLRDLGMAAAGNRKPEEGKKYFSESINLLHKAGNKGHEGISRVKLGRIFADEGKFEEAFEEINKGIKLLEKSPDKFFLSNAYLDRAKVDARYSLFVLNSFAKEDEFIGMREQIRKIIES